jgi:GNAT superfamily N-acetyltransferase
MSQEPEIRNLSQDDLEPLLSLYRQMNPRDDPLPEHSHVRALWFDILHSPSLIYVGGFAGGQLVAACNAAIIPNLTRGTRPYAVIENVVTDTKCRRRGFGSRVMRALLDQCWARHCYKVMLMSSMARVEIHGFYDSLGFDRHAKQAFVIMAR